MRLGVRSSVAGVLVLVSLAAGGVVAGGAVELRYKFKVGQKWVYRLDMRQKLTLSSEAAPGADQVISLTMGAELAQRVTGVEPQAATMEFGFQHMAAAMDMAGTKMPVPGVEDVSKLRMTMHMSPRGETTDVRVINPDAAGPQGRQVAEEMRKSMSQGALVFPEKPLAVGDRWSDERELPAQIAGSPDLKMKLMADYTLAGIETLNGCECARIEAEVKVSMHGVGSQDGVPVQTDMEGIGKGITHFAIAEGRMLQSKTTMHIDGTVLVQVAGASTKSRIGVELAVELKLK